MEVGGGWVNITSCWAMNRRVGWQTNEPLGGGWADFVPGDQDEGGDAQLIRVQGRRSGCVVSQ